MRGREVQGREQRDQVVDQIVHRADERTFPVNLVRVAKAVPVEADKRVPLRRQLRGVVRDPRAGAVPTVAVAEHHDPADDGRRRPHRADVQFLPTAVHDELVRGREVDLRDVRRRRAQVVHRFFHRQFLRCFRDGVDEGGHDSGGYAVPGYRGTVGGLEGWAHCLLLPLRN